MRDTVDSHCFNEFLIPSSAAGGEGHEGITTRVAFGQYNRFLRYRGYYVIRLTVEREI